MKTPLLLSIAACIVAPNAAAQKLPPPTREVFRCEVNGKVLYSDAPCLGAKKVDVEPTRGLTSTGSERAGTDVRRERFNEDIAEALKPLTGKNAKQLNVDAKRLKLTPAAQRECRDLDGAIPIVEKNERAASAEARPPIQKDLLALRKRFIELGC